jgi:hypothetical protein
MASPLPILLGLGALFLVSRGGASAPAQTERPPKRLTMVRAKDWGVPTLPGEYVITSGPDAKPGTWVMNIDAEIRAEGDYIVNGIRSENTLGLQPYYDIVELWVPDGKGGWVKSD